MTVDWSTEWFTSLVWIVGVTIAALVGCVIAVALLTRFTVWGRQFRRLAFPFFIAPDGPEYAEPTLPRALDSTSRQISRCSTSR